MLRTWVIAGIAVAASTGPTLGQDAAAGEQVFKRLCSPCHEIGPDAKIKLGPPLNGIDGRKSGTFDGFNYSPANKSSGITWNEETFPKCIRAPMQEMPGTRMAFVGINIAGNALVGAASLGTVGLDWQLGGFAVDPPTGSGVFADGSNDQLVQAMASFGGDAADDSNGVFLGDDTSQQAYLTTPQA